MKNLLKTPTKRVIFFDGDGTLWYPKTTKWTKIPYWIYKEPGSEIDYCQFLTMTPGSIQTLRQLQKAGIRLVVVSTFPHPPAEAAVRLEQKIEHFKLTSFFEAIFASAPYPEAKGEVITNFLQKLNIPKSHALMVGDSYEYDYLSARQKGIDTVLVAAAYKNDYPKDKRVRRTIQKLPDIFTYI